MFKWLGKSKESRFHNEIQSFVGLLSTAKPNQVATIFGMALSLVPKMEALGIDPYQVTSDMGSSEGKLALDYIEGFVREISKTGNQSAALGAFVWLHTFRAFKHEGLLPYANKIWEVLNTNQGDANEVAEEICRASGTMFMGNAEFVPRGIELQD